MIVEFAKDNGKSIFSLKGYAGTGKTTLIKMMLPELMALGKSINLMAPTGRAAKVLYDKTGHEASTIHRRIYSFDNMQAVRYDDNGNLTRTNHVKDMENVRSKGHDDLQFWYAISELPYGTDPSSTIFIIDESSMISSVQVRGESIHFGTDILMDDLLTYAKLHLGGKIIFVGDPAQLPPVGDNKSVAFDETYFTERSLGVSSYELTEVLRQDGESVILKDAMMVRDLLKSSFRNNLCFESREGEVEKMEPEQVVDSYCEDMPVPEIGESVIICYSNSLVKDYNDAVRRRYFPGCNHVKPGDILQVVRNNLNTYLYNGDFVRVLDVSDNIETQSAAVWTDASGKRERETISINFRDALLKAEDGREIACKIVDNLLNEGAASLTHLQSVALYINFRMRHPNLLNNEEAYKDALMQDPYFNALQVKYGYAITGHKSQGGEWKTAYVDYTGRTGLNDDSLRWIYTATTRARRMLYGVNMPNVTPISKMRFSGITKYGKPAKEAFSFADVQGVDLLPEGVTAAQKQKCMCVKELLDERGFLLKSIKTFQYDDKYSIETPSGSVVIDCYYNGAGMYTHYVPNVILPENDELMAIMENESGMRYLFDYKPSVNSFNILYNKMLSVCDDLKIQITNIVEHLQQYYICYYLKTSGRFSQIQFYFKGNRAISQALPSSDLGDEDDKLVELIKSLED